MNAKHTPGPWGVSADPSHDGYIVNDCHGMNELSRLARVLSHDDGEGETLANARLIASAPSLLKACIEAIEWMEEGAPDDAISTDEFLIRQIIREAIAKAEGDA